MFTDQTYTLFLNQANALLPQVGHQMCGWDIKCAGLEGDGPCSLLVASSLPAALL